MTAREMQTLLQEALRYHGLAANCLAKLEERLRPDRGRAPRKPARKSRKARAKQ
jgi:hypothetical protein